MINMLFLCGMNNTTYIKNNYKSSTLPRLMETFGYETEQHINIDPDITGVLEFLKQQNMETQHVLFDMLFHIHEEARKQVEETFGRLKKK